jgi:hypothetical protein
MDSRTPPSMLRVAYSESSEMTVLLARILTLVAPTSMTTDQQEHWLLAAIDALQDIRVAEVRSIILELQRSIKRPNEIVPEIARLVAEKRKRASQSTKPPSPFFAEREINEESNRRRAAAHGNKAKMDEAYEWERDARIRAGLHVDPRQPPLSREELDNLPSHVARLGLNCGFLKDENGKLAEA